MSKTGTQDRLAAEQALQRRRERRILAAVAAGIVVLLVAGGIGFQAWRSSQQPTISAAPDTNATPVELVNGQPVVFGSPSAPVQLSLYEDFLCPHCAEFEEQYQGVLDEAVSGGRAAIRFYPLAFVAAGSTPAANAFGCAARAGHGESYLRGLFANHQLEWRDDQLTTLMSLVSGAPASEAFQTCVRERGSAAWIDSIAAVATDRGINSTPALFLGDAPVDIATLTPDALRTTIEEAATP